MVCNWGRFEIKRQKAKNYINLKFSNGLVILTGDMYRAKGSAENGIESVEKMALEQMLMN